MLRHLGLAFIRCERIARAVLRDIIDYKQTFAVEYASEEEKLEAYSRCHKRSAERILNVLQMNGGRIPISTLTTCSH